MRRKRALKKALKRLAISLTAVFVLVISGCNNEDTTTDSSNIPDYSEYKREVEAIINNSLYISLDGLKISDALQSRISNNAFNYDSEAVVRCEYTLENEIVVQVNVNGEYKLYKIYVDNGLATKCVVYKLIK